MNRQVKFIKMGLMMSVLLLFSNCSVTKLREQGDVNPVDFYAQLNFTTVKTVIILQGEVNGNPGSFLFDTGADLNLVQRDSTIGKVSKYSGASKRKMKLGEETLSSLKLGEVEFLNTSAANGDLQGLKEQIPNFRGIIGQPVISKANWLIDYPNKRLVLSNKELSDESFQNLDFQRNHGSPYTFIVVNGERYKVIIDFGSSSTINLPENSKLAKALNNSIELTSNERDRYTLGGLQTITEQVGVIPKVELGGYVFENVDVNINRSSQPRIGIGFFKDCEVYIDNINGGYKIKRTRNN